VLARAWIAQAAADAAALPMAAFRAALDRLGPDPVLLAQALDARVPAVMRRLATLPDATDGLVICDASGALLLRKPVDGFLLPRYGAACPLWPLYVALARPVTPVEALGEMPGPAPRRYRLRAWGALRHPQGFGGVEVREALMLVAPEPGPPATPPLRLGGSCRICPRDGCPARREPSILTEPALATIQERELRG
jgi:predicted transcriptional regulator